MKRITSVTKDYMRTIAVLVLLALPLAACSPTGGAPGPAPTDLSATPTSAPEPSATPIQEPTATPQAVPIPSGPIMAGQAAIESLEILMLESFPVQVRVVATGYLSDACTTIGQITHERDGNTFRISIPTSRPQDMACAQVITPFEETIPLDVRGLKAGTYTVIVNGVSETFELSTDNSLP